MYGRLSKLQESVTLLAEKKDNSIDRRLTTREEFYTKCCIYVPSDESDAWIRQLYLSTKTTNDWASARQLSRINQHRPLVFLFLTLPIHLVAFCFEEQSYVALRNSHSCQGCLPGAWCTRGQFYSHVKYPQIDQNSSSILILAW